MAAINLDTAARLDITCRKGDTFIMELDFGETVNTNGWLMHVRETDTSEGDDNIIIEVDDESITIEDNASGVTNAKITITISSDDMSLIDSGLYVHDFQNTSSGVVKTYLYGLFKVNEDVTA